MAQAFFDRLSEHQSLSAGTTVGEQDGRTLQQWAEDLSGPPISMLHMMRDEGLDMSCRVMSQLTREMVDEADKVIVMAEADTLPGYLSPSEKTIFWDLPSIARLADNEIHEIKEQIKVRVQHLVLEVG